MNTEQMFLLNHEEYKSKASKGETTPHQHLKGNAIMLSYATKWKREGKMGGGGLYKKGSLMNKMYLNKN